MLKHNEMKDIVFEIIKEYASEAKPIDQAEIIRIASKNPDYKCERRTVGRALNQLKKKYGQDEEGDWIDEHIHMHFYVVERSSSPIVKGYYFTFHYEDDDEFTDDELMFLMDAVQFSKHVDQKYAEEIIGKLAKLGHNRFSGIFALHSVINEKNVPIKKDFFLILGDINTAITQQKMISFYVNKFGIDKKLHHVSDTPVEVCPFRIVVSDGYYYLLCSARGSNVIKSYRLDLVDDVIILDETFAHNAARKNAALHPNDYLIEHRYMNSGETVNVTLTIDSSILGDVIDSFGTKIKIDESDESCNRLTVHLKSCEKDIIDWAMRYGEYAVITDPEYLRNEISERARRIADYYREDDYEIKYLEQIEKAERFHRLMLADIDLNGKESYKNLNGIHVATFIHNGITDFSFLSSYRNLISLQISYNELRHPEVLAGIERLGALTLAMTDITNLDFLSGLNRLTRLTLREFSLENVEAIYSLPRLEYLVVNKPVARLIDKKRLKRAYGDKFRYRVEDYSGIVSILTDSLPQERNIVSRRFVGDIESFTTCELTDEAKKTELSTEIYAGLRRFPTVDKMYSVIDGSCDVEERKRLYEDFSSYAGSDYVWYVTCEGNDADNLNNVFTISVFKRDHGLKLIAMAKRNPRHQEGRDIDEKSFSSKYAQIMHLMNSNICWAEVSGDLEKLFVRACTAENLIAASVLADNKIFNDIEIDVDDYHYYRKDSSGKKTVKKICYGHIEV